MLPGGVSTAFRAAERPVPLFVREARGAHIGDVDGRGYVDFVCGFGPVILGHSHPEVTDAVTRAAGQLQQVGGQHLAEIELAERLLEHVRRFCVTPAVEDLSGGQCDWRPGRPQFEHAPCSADVAAVGLVGLGEALARW